MAAERDLDLLDDYMSNRLGVDERTAFEQKLKTDPDLKSEFELQQEFISGIKKARIGELKTMLNNIPVPAAPTVGAAVGAKVAIWVAAIGIVGTGLYIYFDNDKAESSSQVQVQQSEQATAPDTNKDEANTEPQNSNDEAPVVSEEPASSEQKPVQSPKAIKKDKSVVTQSPQQPKLDVYDPTTETDENSAKPSDENKNTASKESNKPSIAVEIDSNNKKYNFHYQFKEDKLVLYGPFEKNLYEIMEFFADDKRTLFLFYNEQYYLLREDKGKGSLKPLTAIQDPELLKKLRESRK